MGENIREMLSRARGRAREDATFAKELCNKEEEFVGYLSNEDAKIRKNTALLMGMLPWEAKKKDTIANHLYGFYEKEPVLYVRSSYLKALGQIEVSLPTAMLDGLKERRKYIVCHEFSDEEYKHIAEEQRMLLQLTNAGSSHSFSGIKKKVPLLLTTAKGHEKYLVSDLVRRGANPEDIRKTPFGIRVMTENIAPILSGRLYDKIYFIVPIKKDSLFTYEDRKETIKNSLLYQMLSDYLPGEGCVFFRVNVLLQKEDGDLRHKMTDGFAKTLEQLYPDRLANAPGNYEIEVFFAQRKDDTFGMYLWFRDFKLNRFEYRIKKSSTSMAPVKAACMVEMCYPYLKKDARVLDPFCGSGTLLIERGLKLPFKKAVGVDIFHDAVSEGKASLEIAGVEAELVQKNYFEFTDDKGFDEILTEFPDLFQKDKEVRKQFLKDFLKESLSVSNKGAVWCLLTNEKGLMKQMIKSTKDLILLEEIAFGGYRSLYILKRK